MKSQTHFINDSHFPSFYCCPKQPHLKWLLVGSLTTIKFNFKMTCVKQMGWMLDQICHILSAEHTIGWNNSPPAGHTIKSHKAAINQLYGMEIRGFSSVSGTPTNKNGTRNVNRSWEIMVFNNPINRKSTCHHGTVEAETIMRVIYLLYRDGTWCLYMLYMTRLRCFLFNVKWLVIYIVYLIAVVWVL